MVDNEKRMKDGRVRVSFMYFAEACLVVGVQEQAPPNHERGPVVLTTLLLRCTADLRQVTQWCNSLTAALNSLQGKEAYGS